MNRKHLIEMFPAHPILHCSWFMFPSWSTCSCNLIQQASLRRTIFIVIVIVHCWAVDKIVGGWVGGLPEARGAGPHCLPSSDGNNNQYRPAADAKHKRLDQSLLWPSANIFARYLNSEEGWVGQFKMDPPINQSIFNARPPKKQDSHQLLLNYTHLLVSDDCWKDKVYRWKVGMACN